VADRPSSTRLLVTVTGRDRPGVAAALFDALAGVDAAVLDVEQVQIQGRLLLGVVVDVADPAAADAAATAAAAGCGVHAEAHPVGKSGPARGPDRLLVTVLADRLGPGALAGVFGAVAGAGANVERIVQLARYPVDSYELTVAGGDPDRVRRAVAAAAAHHRIDVATQPAGVHRRAKHLIVLDVDSTLIQGEVVDLLAARAGVEEEVAALTAAAMAGDLDFADALTQRVALLAGLSVDVLDEVRQALVLTPGARTLVRTLRHLGYVTAVVSGGFAEVVAPMAAELGIDRVAANHLEVVDGRLTGRLAAPVVDRAAKAAALVRFAAEAGLPLARTVAVGDGANDLDMLARAGLGIAFNAKPVVRDAADTALNVPYLDAILFLLGLSRAEVDSVTAEAVPAAGYPGSGRTEEG